VEIDFRLRDTIQTTLMNLDLKEVIEVIEVETDIRERSKTTLVNSDLIEVIEVETDFKETSKTTLMNSDLIEVIEVETDLRETSLTTLMNTTLIEVIEVDSEDEAVAEVEVEAMDNHLATCRERTKTLVRPT
jgi:hypothetical protein